MQLTIKIKDSIWVKVNVKHLIGRNSKRIFFKKVNINFKFKIVHFAFSLLLIADELKLDTLVKICETELVKEIQLANAFRTLKIAKQVKSELLKTKALGIIAKNKRSLIGTSEWKDAVTSDPDFLTEIELPTKLN